MNQSHEAAITWKGVVLLLLLGFCWGSFWPAMKIALSEVPLFTFRAISGELGGLLTLFLAVVTGRSIKIPRSVLLPVIGLSLVTTTCWFILSAVGVMSIGSGRATLIAYTMPLWSFLFGILILKDKPPTIRWIGLLFATSGIVLMVSQDTDAFLSSPLGLIAMLAAAVIWGLGAVLVKIRKWPMSNLSFAGWQTVLGSLPICFIALFEDHSGLMEISNKAVLAMLHVGIVGVMAGVAIWFTVLRMLPISVTTLGVMLVPVVGLLSSALLLESFIGWPEYVALALILCSMTTLMPVPNFLKRS